MHSYKNAFGILEILDRFKCSRDKSFQGTLNGGAHRAEVQNKPVHSRRHQNNDVMLPNEGLRVWLGSARLNLLSNFTANTH